MAKKYEDRDVLRLKLSTANSLVGWYEIKMQELRGIADTALIDKQSPLELRERTIELMTSIRGQGHASTLIAQDCELAVTKLAKKYQVSTKSTSERCTESLKQLDQVSRDDPNSAAERHALTGFIVTTLDMFEMGLKPIREVRDTYVEQLNITPKDGKRKCAGRPQASNKEIRDKTIYEEFNSMEGKEAERKKALAKNHDLKTNTISRIIRDQKKAQN